MACIYTYKGKQYSEQEIKDIVFKEKVKPEDIKFATLDDIANILAYSNSKIILDGWKVEYQTPLGNKYDTLEEVNNEIRGLADANAEVDLSGIKVEKQSYWVEWSEERVVYDRPEDPYDVSYYNRDFLTKEGAEEFVEKLEQKGVYDATITQKKHESFESKTFIEKNKEYEQSKEIIEQWKKENNIQYDPEEVYSRGQGFYSSIGAYSNLELDLLLKNLIQHIQDNKKAGENNFKTSLGKKLEYNDPYLPKNALKYFEKYEVLDENKKVIGTVVIEKINDNILQLHPDLKTVGKGYGKELYKYISQKYNSEIREWSGGAISKSEAAKKLWDSFEKEGLAKRTVSEDGDNFRTFKFQNDNYGFTISAFTKPIGSRLKHLEGTGDRVRFVIYPKSNHIKWAAPTDVYSGSVWDAHEKVSKDKKSELLGVSFTKAPALRNINEVSPNLADIIDNLSHVHNELGIELTTNNFRIEYDDNIDYSTKKLIDNINKILDDKYGKLVKSDIKEVKSHVLYNVKDNTGFIKKGNFKTYKEAQEYVEKITFAYSEKKDAYKIEEKQIIGKQPTQTKENTTSIDSVKDNVLGIIKTQRNLEREDLLNQGYKEFDYGELYKPKEYTSQAEINLKIAALKEVARRYPRSLITSKVVPINPNMVDNSEIQYSKKQGYNPKTITDEYGNTWNEVKIKSEFKNQISLNLSQKSAELKALPNNQWFNRTIQPIINRFSKMFPNIRSVVISEKEIPSEVKSIVDGLDKQINSFFHKGQVYIIKERVTKDIAIEEFLHPFVNALEQDNPELFKSLLLEAKKLFPELKEEIFNKYGKVYGSIFDLNREFLTQALTKKVSEQTPKQETWFSKFKTWIRDILDRLFGSDAAVREISMLDETMSLTDLASILNENNTKFNFNSDTNTTYYSLSEEEVINYLNRPKNAIQAELLDKILANNKVTQTDFLGDKHEYTRNELGEILQLKPASSLLPEYKSDKIFEDFTEIGNVIHDIAKSINVNKMNMDEFISKYYESSSLKKFLVDEKGFPDATAHQIIYNLYEYIKMLSKDSLLISEVSISHLQDIDDVFKGVAGTIDLLEIKKDGSMVIHDFKSMYINTDEEKVDNKEATQAKQKFNQKSNRFSQQLSIYKKLLQSITNSDKISLQVYPIFYLAKTEKEGNRIKVVFNNELNKRINFFTNHNNYIYDNIDTLNFNDSIKQYAIEYNKKFADKVLPSIKDELPKKTLSKIELDRQELLNNLTDKIKEDNSKALEIEIEKVFKQVTTVVSQYGNSQNELNQELFKIFDPKGELKETKTNFEIIFKNISDKKGDELKYYLSTLVQYINFIQETNEGLKNIKNHFHVIKAQEKTDAEKIADYRKSYLLAKTHKERIAQTLHQLDDISDDNLFKKMIKESIALIEEIEKKYDRETLPLIANVLNSYITPEFRDSMTKELKDRIAKEKYDLNLVTSESSKKSILNKIEDLEKQLASFEDPNLITKIIKGEYGDGHWFYSNLVANINNPNYVISGTAVMMQHILHDIAMEAVKVEEEFGRQFRQREEAYGVNRDQVKEMNKDMVTTVQRVFEKPDGTIETLDSMQFIVEVNQQVYEDHKKLELLYKNAKTDEEKEKALKDIKDFEKLHFESKYNPKYLNALNKLDVTVSDGRNVMEVRQKILDDITAVRLLEGKEEYKEGNISPENLETLRELTRELFNLSSSFDRNGNKKQGDDLEIAEILQSRSKELEEFREKKVDEELWKKLKTQKIQSLLDKYETEEEVLKSEEYKQWQSYNSSISPTEDFYTERKEKLDKINSILDKKEYKDISLVSQLKDNLNQSWERLTAISREYRDFEREVIAQDVPEGTRKAMKILEENIDKVKQQIKGLEKSLSKEDKRTLNSLWESYNSMVEYKTSKYYTEDLEIALNKYALENDIDVSELRNNSSLMAQFRLNNEWYINSHITKERFDKETGEIISYTEPVYYYKVIIPTNSDYIKETPAFQYSTFELKDEAYNLDEEGKPNYLDVFGRPKIKKTSKYITENIPYLKIKNDLSTKGKINFENIKHITTQLEEVQKDLNKNNLIYYQVPSKFKSTFQRGSEGDFKSIKQNIVDSFFRMTNDEKEFGTRGVLANLSGEEMQFIPVLGKYKLAFKDQSYDVWQSSLEYIMSAKKAKMFEEKLPILDALVDQLEKNNPVEDPNKVEAIGNSMTKKFGLNNVTEAIKGKGTNTLQAVKDEISKGVYEEFTKELANWKGVSDVKIANTVLGFAGTTMMIGKIPNWIVNAMSGNIQLMIEAAGKRYITPTDVKNAKIELTKKSKEVLEDISKISDKSLIGQLTDFFDPMKGEFIDNLGNKFSWSKRTNLHKIFFFGKIFGEWEMQMTSFIAMLKAKKVKQILPNGSEKMIDLYDAFEKGEDGVPKLKEGVQFSERELVDFKLKIQGVNKMLNGSYAKMDQTKIEKYSLGKATMFMKKYLIPLFIQRFGGFRGDMELQDAREGHYRIFYNALLTDIKNLGLGNITEIYAKMNKPPGQGGYTDLQKQAIKKTLAEFAVIALIFLTLALLGYDDDEDDSDTVKFAQYIALKLKREVGLFTPLAATQELSSLVERPFVAMGAVSNVMDLISTIIKLPFNWAFDAFEDDLYYQRKTALWDKGDSKLLSLALKTAGLQVAITNPEQLLQSYKYSIR